MRVLVATHDTNGQVAGDHDFCVDGELVHMQDPCDSDRDVLDGGCGCSRGFAGMNSHRTSTTAMGVDAPKSIADVGEALRSSLEAGGWLSPDLGPPLEAVQLVEELLGDIRGVAERIPVGSVVRRRFDVFTSSAPQS